MAAATAADDTEQELCDRSGPMSDYALGKLAPDEMLDRMEELSGRCLWASDDELPELRARLDRTNRVAGKRKLVRWEL